MRPTQPELVRTVLRRMAGGAGGGLSEQVQPIVQPALRSRVLDVSTTEVVFHLRGPVLITIGDEWPTPGTIQLVRFRVRLTDSGTTTTTVKLYADGTEAAAVSYTSGQSGTKYDDTMAVQQADGYLHVATTAAGTGAAGLVAVAEYVLGAGG